MFNNEKYTNLRNYFLGVAFPSRLDKRACKILATYGGHQTPFFRHLKIHNLFKKDGLLDLYEVDKH